MPQFKAMGDHVTITEHNFDRNGTDQIVHIYTRKDSQNIIRLWCEIHDSFSCIHTEFAWTLPDVQEMVQSQAIKGES